LPEENGGTVQADRDFVARDGLQQVQQRCLAAFSLEFQHARLHWPGVQHVGFVGGDIDQPFQHQLDLADHRGVEMVLHGQGLVQQFLKPERIGAMGGPVQLRQIAFSGPEGFGAGQLINADRKIFLD